MSDRRSSAPPPPNRRVAPPAGPDGVALPRPPRVPSASPPARAPREDLPANRAVARPDAKAPAKPEAPKAPARSEASKAPARSEGPKAPAKAGASKPPARRGASDESPHPPATSVSVRPPRGPARGDAPAGPRAAARPVSAGLRWIQLCAGVAVVLAASIAVAWGARRYVMSSPRFAIRTVLVDGAQRRSAEQVASAGGIEVGKNIFVLDPATAGAAIATDPWIERATVTRKLPSTIQVSVVEREALAIASIGGELYLATRDGDLFKRLGADDPVDLPVVTGLAPDQVARDRAGVVLAVKRVLDVVEDMDRIGLARRYPIQELHIEKDGSLVFTVGKEGIALHLGQPPYRDKVAQAAHVLNEVARRKANASVIFLDNDAHPERVVVRMR
ncbi:MAG: FtsQ-type POTRA domain-containing protein [Polyangiaceae bacterium]|nr:FtsQ-type POTRA domain-containing protein [Polyangiaceae bacterium]